MDQLPSDYLVAKLTVCLHHLSGYTTTGRQRETSPSCAHTCIHVLVSSPLHVFILLLVVSIDAAGVLVVQLQALLAGRGLAVLRHHG